MLPTTAQLPFAKQSKPPLLLPHRAVALSNAQRRLLGQTALVPVVDLDAYRFRVLIDWIEFHVHFTQTTQAQHVQQVLRKFLDRNSYILADEDGPGRTFDRCTIKVQEPKNLAQIAMIHQALCNRFGEAAESRVTGIEVSVDAYPAQPSDEARATLLGALQRTIWTGRDIWWNPDSRPRTVFGKSKGSYYKLPPEPEIEARVNKAKQNWELVTRLDPFHHRVIPVDGTMLLGAKDDDVMVRVMDKVIDAQRFDGTRDDLADDRKRVRIEATVKGAELAAVGITSIPSLRTLKLTTFQKRYFQFRLPAFSCRTNPKTGSDALHNRKQIWRARTYLRSGVTGLMAMDAETRAGQTKMKKRGHKTLRTMNLMKTRTWAGKRLAPPFFSWDQMNRKMHLAFRDLERREATARRKVMC